MSSERKAPVPLSDFPPVIWPDPVEKRDPRTGEIYHTCDVPEGVVEHINHYLNCKQSDCKACASWQEEILDDSMQFEWRAQLPSSPKWPSDEFLQELLKPPRVDLPVVTKINRGGYSYNGKPMVQHSKRINRATPGEVVVKDPYEAIQSS